MSERFSPIRLLVSALHVLLPLAVLGLAIQGTVWLMKNGPKSPKVERKEVPSLVSVQRFAPEETPVVVEGFGTVRPRGVLRLEAEVRGLVQSHHEDLEVGALLPEGATLVTLDDRDYRYQVALAEAQLVKAESALEMEEGRRRVAEREWELLRKEGREQEAAARRLALREPFREDRRADVAAARASLANARVQAERCLVRLPFPALVREEAVEEGRLVGPGTLIAEVVDARAFRVEVALPVSELGRLRDEQGRFRTPLEVTVHREGGGRPASWSGRIERVLPALSETGRMAQVLVLVDDPLATDATHEPLFLGTYVRVRFAGPSLGQHYVLERSWLRDGDTIWIRNEDSRLEIRPVTVLARDETHVVIEGPLSPEEEVVVTPLPVAANGLLLALVEAEEASAEATR